MPVKDDHVIEQFSPAAANPSLCDTVPPWTSVSGAAWFDTHGLDESHHLSAEDRIAVEDQVLRRRAKGERLSQLLNHLCRRRVKGHIEM